jgi:hypothetical protein
MLGLAVSDDYCHAAAFTINNQIVALEVVFGQFGFKCIIWCSKIIIFLCWSRFRVEQTKYNQFAIYWCSRKRERGLLSWCSVQPDSQW